MYNPPYSVDFLDEYPLVDFYIVVGIEILRCCLYFLFFDVTKRSCAFLFWRLLSIAFWRLVCRVPVEGVSFFPHF